MFIIYRWVIFHSKQSNPNPSPKREKTDGQGDEERTSDAASSNMKSDESQAVDDELMRLTISLLSQIGVLGVWLTTAGVCAYVCQRLRLAYSSSKKWNQASASPFLVAISDLTAYSLLVSNNMVMENINSVVQLVNLVFQLGAATASSLRPAIDSVSSPMWTDFF